MKLITLEDFEQGLTVTERLAADVEAASILAEMKLADIRKAIGISQQELSNLLDIAQSNVSQMENRPDALISTLRQYIEALGGELEIKARFPQGINVEITQFKQNQTNTI